MGRAAPLGRVEESFWDEDYLSGVSIPSRPRESVPWERSLAAALTQHAGATAGESVLEIGCAPATWLVFYAERFGARVEGVERSTYGVELSRRNLAAARVESTIHQADFFTFESHRFDLVLSLGFIEHFDDLDAAFDRHLDFVAPGGRLVIGVPNLRGANRLLQAWADREHLERHNLDAMRRDFYRHNAARHGLELEFAGYLGGWDPIIIRVGSARGPRLVAAVAERYRRLRIADRLNQRWFSSYFLAVMRT